MIKKKVNHVSINKEWYNPEIYKNATTLVLGSFNPLNPNDNKNTDYYYGRSSNHFWKSIARNCNLNEDYFCNDFEKKTNFMKTHNFCFYDIIDSIEFICENEKNLDNYIEDKVFLNFLDQNIFKTKTRGLNPVGIIRNYNKDVLELLKRGNINKIIHTMGNITISTDLKTNPVEKIKNNEGLQGYINSINMICEEREIDFIKKSYSPSQYAIKTKKVTIEDLDNWINQHVLINKK